MRKAKIASLIFGILWAATACKKGTPEIANLRSLDGFSLSQPAVTVSSQTDPRFIVTGSCNSRFSKAEVSFDGQKTWMDVSSAASSTSMTCATDGKFRFEFLNDLSVWIVPGSAAANGQLFFRALSDFGNSDPQRLTTQVTSSGHLILTGSHSTTSGAYKFNGQVGGSLTTSSGSYILKSTVRSR